MFELTKSLSFIWKGFFVFMNNEIDIDIEKCKEIDLNDFETQFLDLEIFMEAVISIYNVFNIVRASIAIPGANRNPDPEPAPAMT
ncbi:hypothetical protein IMCC3317_13010 [Kordia antarctica]|uniref:Uncharacterized protein n=1 Tax=Kordia antarctica TaxID=1218801 RepID=A0A7L4ZGV9_9FLAO|nr:hypothetical protein IMCC3317_13010 [Kordia antarctica]